VAQRSVTHLLERYEALLSLTLQDTERLHRITQPQGRVLLALDGLPPDVGHEVLWGIRDCLSGAVLLAHSLLSASHTDLAALLRRVHQAVRGPLVAVVSDGQCSIRKAVQETVPRVPPHLCHLHDVREAANPIYAADRPAKQALKKRVRGVRPIERQRAPRTAPDAEVIRGSCSAVRRALTDDGRPPVDASGLTLPTRRSALAGSLERAEKRGAYPRRCKGSSASSSQA